MTKDEFIATIELKDNKVNGIAIIYDNPEATTEDQYKLHIRFKVNTMLYSKSFILTRLDMLNNIYQNHSVRLYLKSEIKIAVFTQIQRYLQENFIKELKDL
jgi:hypothetical protein